MDLPRNLETPHRSWRGVFIRHHGLVASRKHRVAFDKTWMWPAGYWLGGGVRGHMASRLRRQVDDHIIDPLLLEKKENDEPIPSHWHIGCQGIQAQGMIHAADAGLV